MGSLAMAFAQANIYRRIHGSIAYYQVYFSMVR
jgi:hypothetical protein